MVSNQKEIDVKNGLFILKQYKLRKELGILRTNKYEKIEAICLKYQELDVNFKESSKFELKSESFNSKEQEFERVLQELQRRENLIRELLTKLEQYESTPKEQLSNEVHILMNKSVGLDRIERPGFENADLERTVYKSKPNKNINLWRSLLNTVLGMNIVKKDGCFAEREKNNLRIECKHKSMLDIYKKKILFLLNENEKLRNNQSSLSNSINQGAS